MSIMPRHRSRTCSTAPDFTCLHAEAVAAMNLDPTQPPGSTQDSRPRMTGSPAAPREAEATLRRPSNPSWPGGFFDFSCMADPSGRAADWTPASAARSRRLTPDRATAGPASFQTLTPRPAMRKVLFVLIASLTWFAWTVAPGWPLVLGLAATAVAGLAWRAARPGTRRQVNPERYRLTLPL